MPHPRFLSLLGNARGTRERPQTNEETLQSVIAVGGGRNLAGIPRHRRPVGERGEVEEKIPQRVDHDEDDRDADDIHGEPRLNLHRETSVREAQRE